MAISFDWLIDWLIIRLVYQHLICEADSLNCVLFNWSGCVIFTQNCQNLIDSNLNNVINKLKKSD
jgi:hypothetical protein